MALIKCKECGNQVSSKADKCPQCGAAVKKKTSGCAMLFLIISVFMIIVTAMVYLNPPPKGAAPDMVGRARKLDAWSAAEKFVKDRLKSPSTANFGDGLLTHEQDVQNNVTVLPDGSYRVHIWVDAQNSYGGVGRTTFVLHMAYQKDGDRWTLLEEPIATQR